MLNETQYQDSSSANEGGIARVAPMLKKGRTTSPLPTDADVIGEEDRLGIGPLRTLSSLSTDAGLRIRWLGRVDYDDALVLQRRLCTHCSDNYLLLLEHPHVVTLGRRGRPEHLLVDVEALGGSVVRTDRGGEVTYHGPGQLVGYPILTVPGKRGGGMADTAAYVTSVEQLLIDVLAGLGVEAGRLKRHTGVWVDPGGAHPRKIAAIGVRLARSRSMHGFALNVDPDLSWFNRIVPCGITSMGVTSLAAEGVDVSMREVVDRVAEQAAQTWSGGAPVDRADVAHRVAHHDLAPFTSQSRPNNPVVSSDTDTPVAAGDVAGDVVASAADTSVVASDTAKDAVGSDTALAVAAGDVAGDVVASAASLDVATSKRRVRYHKDDSGVCTDAALAVVAGDVVGSVTDTPVVAGDVAGNVATGKRARGVTDGTSVRLLGRLSQAGVNGSDGVAYRSRKPEWMKVPLKTGPEYRRLRSILRDLQLVTVCEEAGCPNISECWNDGTATFMILGDRCTRACGFCLVDTRRPKAADPSEPKRIAEAAALMGLEHVVVTMVARDDLPDGGAGAMADTVIALRDRLGNARVETLISDMQGDVGSLETVFEARPDVVNHNIETVARLQRAVRPSATYARSLAVLARARNAGLTTKSSIIVGMGETHHEVVQTLSDLRSVGTDIVTIGQYLRPSQRHLPVMRWWPPKAFAQWKKIGESFGISHVEASPLTRSSYHARQAADSADASR